MDRANDGRAWQPEMMRPILIGGCPRSGTTLLGAVLGTHRDCLATPESKFNPDSYRLAMNADGTVDLARALAVIREHWNFRLWDVVPDAEESAALAGSETYCDMVKRVVQVYGSRRGKPAPAYWIDHTPYNILHVPLLFQIYPDARLIHLVRDGRGVAASVMKLDWGPNTVEAAAQWWIVRVAHGLAAESYFGPERVLRVSYEALVRDPQTTMQQVCAFIGVAWQPEMIAGTGFQVPKHSTRQHGLVGAAPQAARATAWQKELSPRQVEIFESVAASVLTCLGYDPHYGSQARPLTLRERVISQTHDFYMTKIVNRYRIQARVRHALAQGADAR